MKTMNLIIKQAVLGLILICISTVSYASDSEHLVTSSETVIERLTQEVKSKVNLTEIARSVKESALVVVQIVINTEGIAVVNNSSANNPEFEDFVTHKLSNIEMEFPEDYIGKTIIYRFSLI